MRDNGYLLISTWKERHKLVTIQMKNYFSTSFSSPLYPPFLHHHLSNSKNAPKKHPLSKLFFLLPTTFPIVVFLICFHSSFMRKTESLYLQRGNRSHQQQNRHAPSSIYITFSFVHIIIQVTAVLTKKTCMHDVLAFFYIIALL